MEADLKKVMATGVLIENTSPHFSAEAFRRLSTFGKAMMMERMRALAAADRKYRDDAREKERGRMRVMAPGVASAISALREVQRETKYRNIARQEEAAARAAATTGAATGGAGVAPSKARLPMDVLKRIGEFVPVKHDKRYWPVEIKKFNTDEDLNMADGNSWEDFFPTAIATKGKDTEDIYFGVFPGGVSGRWVVDVIETLYPGALRDEHETRRDREGDDRYALLRVSAEYANRSTTREKAVDFTKKLANYDDARKDAFIEVIRYADGDTRTFSKAGTLGRLTLKIEGTTAQKNNARDWFRELFAAMTETYA